MTIIWFSIVVIRREQESIDYHNVIEKLKIRKTEEFKEENATCTPKTYQPHHYINNVSNEFINESKNNAKDEDKYMSMCNECNNDNNVIMLTIDTGEPSNII